MAQPKLTYAQIKALQRQYGVQGVDTAAFASGLSQAFNTDAYSAGAGTGFGSAVNQLSYGIDEGLRRFMLPDAFENAGRVLGNIYNPSGNSAAGEFIGESLRGVPRTAIDLAPMLLGGVPGVVGTAAATAANTYEKTDSPLAAGVSAALTPLFPLAGKVGGKVAASLPWLSKEVTAPLAMGAKGLLEGGEATAAARAGTAAALTDGGVFRSGATRTAQFLGQQAGNVGGVALSSGLTNAAAAPSGQRWNAFTQAFEPVNLLKDAVSLVPFMAKDGWSARQQGAEARFANQYENTLRRYDAETFLPGRVREQLQNDVAQSQLRLGESSPLADAFRAEQDRVRFNTADMASKQEAVSDVNAKTVTPKDSAGLFNLPEDASMLRGTPATPDAFVAAVKSKKKRGKDVAAELWQDLEPVSRSQILTETTPDVVLPAALAETGVTQERLGAEVEAQVKRGLPVEDATQEVYDRVVTQAQESVAQRTVRQERDAANEADRVAWVSEWEKSTTPEHRAVWEARVKQLDGTHDKLDSTTALMSRVRDWYNTTNGQGDAESLRKALDVKTQFRGTKNTATRTPIGKTDGSSYKTAEKGSGVAVQTYNSKADAQFFREQLATEHPEFQWTAFETAPGSGKYQIARYEWNENSGQSGEAARRNLTEEDAATLVDEANAEREPFTQAEQDATRPEERAAVEERVATASPRTYIEGLPREELSMLGEGDAQLGSDRVEALFGLMGQPLERASLLDGLFKSGLFSDRGKMTEFLADVREHVVEFAREQGRAFGSTTVEGAQVGERQTLGGLLKRVGLADPAYVDEAARLLSLYDAGDTAYAQLLPAYKGTTPLGLFTQATDGQKLVWLAAGHSPERTMFTLAHELNGHGLWALLDAGKLDKQTTHRLEEYRNTIRDNSPEDNRTILNEVFNMLPDRYKKDEGLRRLAETTVADGDEVLANINAVASLAMVNAKPSAWREFLHWMPKPIGDAIASFARYGRKVLEAISGVAYLRRKGVLPAALDLGQTKQLHGYIDGLYKVLGYDGQRLASVRDAIRLDMAMSAGKEAAGLLDGTLFAEHVSPTTDTIVKAFGAKPAGDEPKRKGVLGKLSSVYDRVFQPLQLIAQKYPQFARVATVGTRREARNNILESEALKPLSLTYDGVKWVADKKSPVLAVANDPRLAGLRDDLIRRAQVTGQPVDANIAAKDAETVATLAKMSPAEQTQVREAILRHQDANGRLNTIARDQRYERLGYQLAETLMLGDSTMRAEQALARGQMMVEAAKAGTLAEDGTAASAFAKTARDRIEQDFAYYNSNPQYVSEQRFGDFKVRVKYADKRQDGVFDAKTEFERNQILRRFEPLKASGEVTSIIALPVKKAQFSMKDAATQLLIERERGMRESLVQSLVANGIEPDAATRIADNHSVAGDLQREIAAQGLPNRAHRRLAEGREDLDMLSQQLEYMQMLVHGLTKGTADAEFRMRMQDPEVRDHAERPTFEQAWKQYREADPAAVRIIGKWNYATFLSFHALNAMQDATQPLTGTLVPNLVDAGGGVLSSYKRVMSAMARVGQFRLNPDKLPADERAVLERYRAGNRGLASYSDEANNEIVQAVNARRVAQGLEPETIGKMLARPANAVMLWSKGLHKKFTDYGQEAAMLAAYDHYKTVGRMSPKDAEAAAFDMATRSMASWGKAGRAVGVFSGSKSLGATLTALQTFAFNQIGTWKNLAERGWADLGLSKTEKANARKAFATHSAVMFATAGLFGMPFVAAAMKILDKTFGINSQETIADWLQSDDSDDHTLQQLALRGMYNTLGGVDLASRSSTPGVLGLNPVNGWTPESLAGPTWSVLQNIFGAGASLGHGDVAGAAVSVLPNNLKRGLQQWRDDFEFRQRDGTLIDRSTAGEQAVYAVFGVKPARIASAQERSQWQRVDAELEKDERTRWLNSVAEQLQNDPSAARQAIYERVLTHPGESQNALANSVAEKVIDRTMPHDPRRDPGSSAQLNQTTGAPTSLLDETQRLALSQQVLAQLGVGLPASRQRWQRASAVDEVRQMRPWLSYDEAVRIVEAGEPQLPHGLGGGRVRSAVRH